MKRRPAHDVDALSEASGARFTCDCPSRHPSQSQGDQRPPGNCNLCCSAHTVLVHFLGCRSGHARCTDHTHPSHSKHSHGSPGSSPCQLEDRLVHRVQGGGEYSLSPYV